jgi:hypothetical protein
VVIKEFFSGFEFLFLMFICDVRPVLIFISFLMLLGEGFFLEGVFFILFGSSFIYFSSSKKCEEGFKVRNKNHG